MKLYSPSMIQDIRERYDFKLSKSLGQNFITDRNVIEKIVEGAQIGPADLVIEIGPGIGVLTAAAAEQAATGPWGSSEKPAPKAVCPPWSSPAGKRAASASRTECPARRSEYWSRIDSAPPAFAPRPSIPPAAMAPACSATGPTARSKKAAGR